MSETAPENQSLPDLSAIARTMPVSRRQQVIEILRETELHQRLKRLLERKLPQAVVEITHGSDEYGKDIVLIDDDQLTERVAAFVVKRGKVGGRSAGVIDEIVSQVNQAFRHPARLRCTVDLKTVNRVYVVIAGPVTKNAGERIKNEVAGTVQDIWDLQILVDEFTKHYPEVFFESAVLDFLQRRITELESGAVFTKLERGKNLSEWFVDPVVLSPEPIEARDVVKARFPGEPVTYSFAKLKDVLHRAPRLLLIGAPGSGKSAVLTKLAADLTREAFDKAIREKERHPAKIPLLISAGDLLECEQTADMIRLQFESHADADELEVSCLLIDGLDEVRADSRPAVLEKARSFAEELKCSLIITSRWVEALRDPIPGFHQVELLEFQVNQAIKLFEKLVPEGELLNSLREGLDRIQNQLQMTPLTLVLLIETVREYREIPSSVTELYERFFDYTLGRHDPDKGIEVVYEYHIKKVFLSELAYERFFERDKLEIDRDVYEEFADRFVVKYGINDKALFLSEIERSNVLRLSHIVEYGHRSFLDYFVAQNIVASSLESSDLLRLLVETYFSRTWTEVAFFYFGVHRRVEEKVIRTIFSFPGDDFSNRIMKLLAGRLLQAGWMSPVAVKDYAVAKSIEFAPGVRTDLLKAMTDEDPNVPSILGDIYLLIIGGMSFGSSWLTDALMRAVSYVLDEPTEDKIVSSICLFGGLRGRLQASELDSLVDRVLGAIAQTDLTPEIQARLVWTLTFAGGEHPEAKKRLEARLKRILSRHPGLAEVVFPQKPKRLVDRRKRKRRRGKAEAN